MNLADFPVITPDVARRYIDVGRTSGNAIMAQIRQHCTAASKRTSAGIAGCARGSGGGAQSFGHGSGANPHQNIHTVHKADDRCAVSDSLLNQTIGKLRNCAGWWEGDNNARRVLAEFAERARATFQT